MQLKLAVKSLVYCIPILTMSYCPVRDLSQDKEIIPVTRN